MDGELLTEQETALYDRQIRVWGADAQRRLSKAHVLVAGMKGTVAEFCKNIVLAGVGSVTLVDDRPVTEEALNANFLIPPDEDYAGKTIADVCCESLKDFNPMVRVSVEKVLERFEELEGRYPGETSVADLPNILKLRKELCEAQSSDESRIPDSLLERLLLGRMEFPPICAILGGIIGQEVIKAISCKGEPIKNFFYFDATDGKGIIEDISIPDPTN